MAVTARERGKPSVLGLVSECLAQIFGQAELLNELDGLRQTLQSCFDSKTELQQVSQEVREKFIFVLVALRDEPSKIHLALKTLN